MKTPKRGGKIKTAAKGRNIAVWCAFPQEIFDITKKRTRRSK